MDNYFNLRNRLNIHEGEHYAQWQSKEYSLDRDTKEILAVAKQMFHDTWSQTTKDFKEDAIHYMLKALSNLIGDDIEE